MHNSDKKSMINIGTTIDTSFYLLCCQCQALHLLCHMMCQGHCTFQTVVLHTNLQMCEQAFHVICWCGDGCFSMQKDGRLRVSWSSSWLPHCYSSVWTQRISIDRSSQAGIKKNSPIKYRIVDHNCTPPDWCWAVSCQRHGEDVGM